MTSQEKNEILVSDVSVDNVSLPYMVLPGGPIFTFHFPEEVWLLIFDELREDTDRVNCCRAFPYLDNILTRSKPVWLFKQILPYLGGPYLNFNELLNCRAVCTQWCEDIDKKWETSEDHFERIRFRYTFTRSEQLTNILESFPESSRNPIIGRAFFIQIARQEPMYQSQVEELLSRFGDHIRSLYLFDGPEPAPAIYWYPCVQRAVRLTPKLKKLSLYGSNGLFDPMIADNFAFVDNFGGRLVTTLFPFLPSLEIMNLSLCNFHTAMRDMIMLPYTHQLKRLVIRMGNWDPGFAHGLANLTSLDLDCVESVEQLEMLTNTPFTGPLTSLKLDNVSAPGLSAIVLLRLIRHLPLLEGVHLKLGDGCGLEDGEEYANFSLLQNSTVTSIEIKHNILISYRFLGCLKALRSMVIKLRAPFNGNSLMEEDKLEWASTAITLLKGGGLADIWKALPRLKGASIYKVVGGRSQRMLWIYDVKADATDL